MILVLLFLFGFWAKAVHIVPFEQKKASDELLFGLFESGSRISYYDLPWRIRKSIELPKKEIISILFSDQHYDFWEENQPPTLEEIAINQRVSPGFHLPYETSFVFTLEIGKPGHEIKCLIDFGLEYILLATENYEDDGESGDSEKAKLPEEELKGLASDSDFTRKEVYSDERNQQTDFLGGSSGSSDFEEFSSQRNLRNLMEASQEGSGGSLVYYSPENSTTFKSLDVEEEFFVYWDNTTETPVKWGFENMEIKGMNFLLVSIGFIQRKWLESLPVSFKMEDFSCVFGLQAKVNPIKQSVSHYETSLDHFFNHDPIFKRKPQNEIGLYLTENFGEVSLGGVDVLRNTSRFFYLEPLVNGSLVFGLESIILEEKERNSSDFLHLKDKTRPIVAIFDPSFPGLGLSVRLMEPFIQEIQRKMKEKLLRDDGTDGLLSGEKKRKTEKDGTNERVLQQKDPENQESGNEGGNTREFLGTGKHSNEDSMGSKKKGNPTIDCEVAQEMPSILLKISSEMTLRIFLKDLIAESSQNGKRVCVLKIFEVEIPQKIEFQQGQMAIIGEALFKNYYLHIDNEKNKIGFAVSTNSAWSFEQ